MPGVQMPHCAPPCVMKDCWTAWRHSPSATPSIVRMLAPCACIAGTRQLLTSAPSISIEHAPHSPSPHPSFVPLRCNCSRKVSSKRAMGYVSSVVARPLTRHATRTFECAAATGSRMCALQHGEENFGRYGNARDVGAGCVRDGVCDGGRCAVERQFADSFRSCRPASVWDFLEAHADRRNV